jgi:hypothetical protein
MTTPEADFDYGELGRDWWLKTAAQVGASERHAKFAAAKHRGCTNTEAARVAGFGVGSESSTRSEGYRLLRSNRVNQLLALATVESGSGYDGTVSRQESKQILTSLARGSDPAIRIKSIELLSKMEREEVAASRPEEPSLAESLWGMINALPESGIGAALALGAFFNSTGNIINCPHLTECAPIVAKNFPGEWGRWKAASQTHWHALLNEMAAGPLLEGDELVAAVKRKLPVPVKSATVTKPIEADHAE